MITAILVLILLAFLAPCLGHPQAILAAQRPVAPFQPLLPLDEREPAPPI